MKLMNASLTGGVHGIDAHAVNLTDSVVTGHSDTAVDASRITLNGSTITGNALDLRADHRPRLKNSTCQRSNGWGVCTND